MKHSAVGPAWRAATQRRIRGPSVAFTKLRSAPRKGRAIQGQPTRERPNTAYRQCTCIDWAHRFLDYLGGQQGSPHPEVRPEGVRDFLTHLATHRRVSATTQNQAMCAILFLCREVLGLNPEGLSLTPRAKRVERLPVVLSVPETAALLAAMRGVPRIMAGFIYGGGLSVRPKLMTVAAAMMGLMPIMWSLGTGSDVMKRVAAPMDGGLATSFLMELRVYQAIYLIWKRREMARR